MVSPAAADLRADVASFRSAADRVLADFAFESDPVEPVVAVLHAAELAAELNAGVLLVAGPAVGRPVVARRAAGPLVVERHVARLAAERLAAELNVAEPHAVAPADGPPAVELHAAFAVQLVAGPRVAAIPFAAADAAELGAAVRYASARLAGFPLFPDSLDFVQHSVDHRPQRAKQQTERLRMQLRSLNF